MNETKYSGIRVIKHISRPQKAKLAIVGMPGIADVGKFAIDTLIGQLDAQNYLDIIFDDYPAGAIVDNSLLSAPKAEILISKNKMNGMHNGGLLLVTSDAQSLNPKGIYRISNFLSEIIYNCGVELIVALGAYPINSNKLNSKVPKIYASSTSSDFLNSFLAKNRCEKIKKGVIIGANGLIPTLAKARYNIDGLVLLAETDNIAIVNEDITDLRASISLLKLLGESFEIPIKKKYSLENIDTISKNLQLKREQLENDLEKMNPYERAEEKKNSFYI
ncbi:MAG: PAC2 family protein [Promethearchaeota archaeon]|nr:MAG: PAC2 family protein [Candidatus Lokiarchaeota archaeon]